MRRPATVQDPCRFPTRSGRVAGSERTLPLDHYTRGPVGSQPAHRPQPGFEPAVITLAPVVLTLPSVMERRRDQLINHAGQRRRTVGDRPQVGDLHVCLTGKHTGPPRNAGAGVPA